MNQLPTLSSSRYIMVQCLTYSYFLKKITPGTLKGQFQINYFYLLSVQVDETSDWKLNLKLTEHAKTYKGTDLSFFCFPCKDQLKSHQIGFLHNVS